MTIRVTARVAARASALSLVVGVTACGLPRWPVEGPLVEPFGVRWNGIVPEVHRGVDIQVDTGTNVRATSGGRVHFSGPMGDYGLVVWLDHGSDILTVYAHLSELLVREGQAVSGGEVVGLSGSTGNASGPHLHFEVWRHGHQVDPVAMLGSRPNS